MNAKELRIGNYVNHCNSVKQLDAELFLQLLKYTTPFDPIPLTEEWLVKFGFEFNEKGKMPNHTHFYSTSYIDINYAFCYADFREDWGMYIEYTDSPFPEDYGIKRPVSFGIKYVHTLQNLYFALTNEEL